MNDRQRSFAQEYAKDKNATQAAIRAGYSAKTAYSSGQRLLNHVEVRAHIERIFASSAKHTELTIASVTTKLLSLSEKSELLEGPSALNVARQCIMDAAKLNGLVVESSEVVTRSPEERAARMSILKAERERISRPH